MKIIIFLVVLLFIEALNNRIQITLWYICSEELCGECVRRRKRREINHEPLETTHSTSNLVGVGVRRQKRRLQKGNGSLFQNAADHTEEDAFL